jgi:hypothetical protein
MKFFLTTTLGFSIGLNIFLGFQLNRSNFFSQENQKLYKIQEEELKIIVSEQNDELLTAYEDGYHKATEDTQCPTTGNIVAPKGIKEPTLPPKK